MRALDTFSFPLHGPALIEASAGTGKTYTIVNLYLRLLLGHQCQPLSVEQILVVTFTNAATAELKERVRQKLQQSYLDFYAGHSDDAFVQRLLESLSERELAAKRLALALKQLDQAAIFTIHSFCQRMLSEHAFESGVLYEQSLILDELPYVQVAVEDYWRRDIVTQPAAVLKRVLDCWRSPQQLLATLRPLLSRRAKALSQISIATVKQYIDDYQAEVGAVKRWWLSNNVAALLLDANLRGNVKLGKADFLDKMTAYCHSEQIEPEFDKEGWANFLPEKVAKAAKKDSKDISQLDFSRFESLVALQQKCEQGLRQAFSQAALAAVQNNLKQHKHSLRLLSPDDLLSSLAEALSSAEQGDNILARRIRECYPAALIDEFQDTDPIQFSIFRAIYAPPFSPLVDTSPVEDASPDDVAGRLSPSWIMIGDPKQAIYAFRGADIFTYIQAKQLVSSDRQFTLSRNFRSRQALVNAVNSIFMQRELAFLVEDSIPFVPVEAARQAEGLVIDKQAQASLEFAHLPAGERGVLNFDSAGKIMAQDCAGQIARLLQLAAEGRASAGGRALRAGDCCVLVRDRIEAELIKQALAKVNVASVFLARKSVFGSQIAYDLLMLLQALAYPGSESKLKAALMSSLFAFDAAELDALFADELRWQSFCEQVFVWHKDWIKHGLMLVIQQVCQQFNLYDKQVSHYADGLRRITDLRHLIELLQQQSAQLSGISQLLHWFERHLADPDDNHEAQQLRLETDANLVQIITQHAAKGLEFPLVFIPFVARYRAAKEAIFHDDNQALLVDFLAEDANLARADHERLAEDIRLLYVALTRAVYFCSVGLWNVVNGKSKQSDLSNTALGTLLWHDNQAIDDEQIVKVLQALCQASMDSDGVPAIAYRAVDENFHYAAFVDPAQAQPVNWREIQPARTVRREWQLTSYSAIASQHVVKEVVTPGFDEGDAPDQLPDNPELIDNSPSPFTFVRGANAGSFLHGVLEKIDFRQADNLAEVITEKAQWYGIDEFWLPMLQHWLNDVLHSPFSQQNDALSLSLLAPQQVKIEMEFHLPLHKVRASQFNQILNQYAPQRTVNYQFEQLNGMLKGYIDLLFEYQGQYYVADYKSNHLGYQLSDYQGQALESAMGQHDYHLQAILYSLALHRWLKQRLAEYSYERHVGGAYYLFLRGMSAQAPGNGVYHYRPAQDRKSVV